VTATVLVTHPGRLLPFPFNGAECQQFKGFWMDVVGTTQTAYESLLIEYTTLFLNEPASL
jgi:hypothetical protein